MLVLSSIADVIRVDKNDLNTAVIIETKRPYTVISKHAVHNYFWHYVASAIVGILLLTVITYIMHRVNIYIIANTKPITHKIHKFSHCRTASLNEK